LDFGGSHSLTADDYMTADGDGSICRRNGRAYSQMTVSVSGVGNITTSAVSAGYNYPNAINPATGVATTCTAPATHCTYGAPTATGDTKATRITAYGFPYYYTTSNYASVPNGPFASYVWFCDGVDAGGWGTGNCGRRQDPALYKYVRYSASDTSGPGFVPTAFTRVDIMPSGFLVNGVAAANPSGRSYALEMANFAKWYAFHRTRILAMQTASGAAFSALSDTTARVGLATLNSNASHFLNVKPFDSANKKTWFEHFYGVAPANNTPLPDAVRAAGEYFSGSGGFSGALDPLDPTTGQCQRNYHLLSTDGYWNIPLSSGSVGDRDQTVPGSLPGPIPEFTDPALNKNFPKFPPPYYEGPTQTNNSLSDLAMYYWIRDIRPGLADKVQDTVAPWQHVTLYGLAIGAQGRIVYPSGLDAILAGTQDWPVPTGTGGPDSIDDLWHAALNSRGKFFNAKDPQELAASVVQALNEFTGQAGTGTAVGIAGPQFSATNKFGYRTSYEIGWSGDLMKYVLDPAPARCLSTLSAIHSILHYGPRPSNSTRRSSAVAGTQTAGS
jgi:type IV pilus assembly protein PilY1